MICLSLSQVLSLSLTPFPRSSTQGGNFLTNMSLNPPTQTPTACRDWQKRKNKKKSGFYTNLRKCLKPSSHTCDLWNVTRLCSIIIKKPELLGETGQKQTVVFSSDCSNWSKRRHVFFFLDCLASVEFCWCYLEQHVRITFICPLRWNCLLQSSFLFLKKILLIDVFILTPKTFCIGGIAD